MMLSLMLCLYCLSSDGIGGSPARLLHLRGSYGERIDSSDLVQKRCLVLYFDEHSWDFFVKNRMIKDLESEKLKVVFLFLGPEPTLNQLQKAWPTDEAVFLLEAGSQWEAPCSSGHFWIEGGMIGAVKCKPPETDALFQQAVEPNGVSEGIGGLLGTDGVLLQKRRTDCAAAATAMLLDRLMIPHRREDALDCLDPGPQERLVSLLEIKNHLANFGLSSSGWRGDMATLQSLEQPVLLYFKSQHYVVLSHFIGTGAVILDPAVGRRFIPIPWLQDLWGGVFFRIDPLHDSYY